MRQNHCTRNIVRCCSQEIVGRNPNRPLLRSSTPHSCPGGDPRVDVMASQKVSQFSRGSPVGVSRLTCTLDAGMRWANTLAFAAGSTANAIPDPILWTVGLSLRRVVFLIAMCAEAVGERGNYIGLLALSTRKRSFAFLASSTSSNRTLKKLPRAAGERRRRPHQHARPQLPDDETRSKWVKNGRPTPMCNLLRMMHEGIEEFSQLISLCGAAPIKAA